MTMKFNFFTPVIKIQKQRNIMRATDLRLVRYATCGIILSLVIFMLAMLLGDYYQQQPVAAYVFAIGIAITTAFKAYHLLRFDTLYPRGPSRWRNIFFTIAVGSAAWWGIMLASVTYEVGMYHETPLLWLYTIAFFSSCSHVFSPYKRFYNLYMLCTVLPCSLVAIFSLNALEVLYGLLLLGLFLLLQKQGNSQGSAHWDRLQATYDLTQRANALQAEKISSESTLFNKDTLFTNLAGELKASLREVMGSLQLLKLAQLPEQEEQLVVLAEQKSQKQMYMLQNIVEFSQISRKNIRLDEHVIDLRACIETAVTSISDQVYKKNIEILLKFSEDFPIRVRGDSNRIEQILINMIVSAIDYADSGCLLLDIDYAEHNKGQSLLAVKIFLDNPIRTLEVEQQLHDAFQPHYANNMSQGLSLAIANGLSNCMQGNAGANYTAEGHLNFWFTAVLPTVTPANLSTQNIAKFNGKRLLLYNPPLIIESEYKHTLESWGLVVDVVYDYGDAVMAIKHSQTISSYFDMVMIYTHINDLEGIALANELAELPIDSSIPMQQLICITDLQSKLSPVEQLLSIYPNIELIRKPIEYKQLRKRLKDLLITDHCSPQPLLDEDFLSGKQVLLFQNEEMDLTIAEVMLKKLGCRATTVKTVDEAKALFTRNQYDAFITESHIDGIDMRQFIGEAKAASQKLHSSDYVFPVLGLSHQYQAGEETRCLQSGMDYYIDSPLQIDDLRAILRRWIGRAIHLSNS